MIGIEPLLRVPIFRFVFLPVLFLVLPFFLLAALFALVCMFVLKE